MPTLTLYLVCQYVLPTCMKPCGETMNQPAKLLDRDTDAFLLHHIGWRGLLAPSSLHGTGTHLHQAHAGAAAPGRPKGRLWYGR